MATSVLAYSLYDGNASRTVSVTSGSKDSSATLSQDMDYDTVVSQLLASLELSDDPRDVLIRATLLTPVLHDSNMILRDAGMRGGTYYVAYEGSEKKLFRGSSSHLASPENVHGAVGFSVERVISTGPNADTLLTITLLTGKKVSIRVPSSMAVGEFKVVLEEHTGVKPDFQDLIYSGKTLDDDGA